MNLRGLSLQFNAAFRGMSRVKRAGSADGQAEGYLSERTRPDGIGAGGQKVARTASVRARQDLAAVGPNAAQSRAVKGAGPQHQHGADSWQLRFREDVVRLLDSQHGDVPRKLNEAVVRRFA